MASLSITRLCLRSYRYLPGLLWYSLLSARQARRADGCLGVALTRRGGAFWTLTVWRDSAAMRAFMLSGSHRKVMPKLAEWCDEASVARLERHDEHLPDWPEAERLMAEHGRQSPVKFPSVAQTGGAKPGSVETAS
jgi:hypothetical protein